MDPGKRVTQLFSHAQERRRPRDIPIAVIPSTKADLLHSERNKTKIRKSNNEQTKIKPPETSNKPPSRTRVVEETSLPHFQSPWEIYRKAITFQDLGGRSLVAVSHSLPARVVNIREFPMKDMEKTLYWFQRIRHSNVVTVIDIFIAEEKSFVILEQMDVTLDHVIQCIAYPRGDQLAVILGQIINGLVGLQEADVEIESLATSDILLDKGGNVKLGNQQRCQPRDSGSSSRDIQLISKIAMLLMQKYVKTEAVGLDRPDRWICCPEALAFLSATTSASSADQLLQHPLFNLGRVEDSRWRTETLIDLVLVAQVSANRSYEYKP